MSNIIILFVVIILLCFYKSMVYSSFLKESEMVKFMRVLLFIPLLMISLTSCENWGESIYTDNQLEYELATVSGAYNYSGKAIIKEFSSGELELTLTLEGKDENRNYSFPAHLHHGHYDGKPNPEIFQMLNPIDIRTLKSVTILNDNLDFENMKNFDGHIKVHLASEGPDYNVILVAGNVGRNASDE